MSMIPGDLTNPRMSDLADDNERAIAVLRINYEILCRERGRMEDDYLEVRETQDAEIRVLWDEIKRREDLRNVPRNTQRNRLRSDSGDASL